MRIAITGSTGRLGSALLDRAAGSGIAALPWTRDELDLDAPSGVAAALDRDRPDAVIHCAAWTDVDGNAREPALAEQRNGIATGVLARASAERAIGLVVISTNEVFDGRRTDSRPYRPSDPASPANPYGRAKRLGEELATAAFERRPAPLWIVRTAWLFGPPRPDFPSKIAAAALAAREQGSPLRLVADEIGSPTFSRDLAAGVLDLVADRDSAGVHHVVNRGAVSRAAWARRVLEELGIEVETEDVSLDTWPRPSTPPRWGVLEPTPLPTLGTLRPWELALAEDLRGRRAAMPLPAPTGG
jgi:dTDP-4-dehydrorhamnose reductase